MVQNKLHFAAHWQTASEVIYNRADAEKEFMWLTTFKGSLPIKSETTVAKNYLDEKELKKLNNIVSWYFDFAEAQAMEHKEMTMKDYREHLYRIIKANNYKLLIWNWKITHNQAAKKAHSEYKKYQVKTLSDIEKAYLDNLKMIEEKVKK
jgi:hypothetical protein